MKKLMIAVLAGFMSLAVGGAYAADMKKDEMKKAAPAPAPAAAPAPAPAADMAKDDMKKSKRARRATKG